MSYNLPDSKGHFEEYGGKYVPETLIPAITDLEYLYEDVRDDEILPAAVILFHLCVALPKSYVSAVCGTILALALTAPNDALIVNNISVELSTPMPYGLCNSVVANALCNLAIRCSYFK